MTAPRKGRSVEKENVAMEMVSSTPGWGLVSTGRGQGLRTKGLPSCPRPVGALILAAALWAWDVPISLPQ